MLTWLLWWWS